MKFLTNKRYDRLTDTVNIHTSGRFTFSLSLCQRLSLTLGDQIGIGYDDHTDTFGITLEQKNFTLKKNNTPSKSLIVNCKAAANIITQGRKYVRFRYDILKDGVYIFKKMT